MLIGGDFNILRYQEEENNDRFDTHWPFLFNVVIDRLDLREVSMSGRQFTWANNHYVPTYEKLDRVLMDTEWELKFPLVTVRALERIEALSDHMRQSFLTLTLRTHRPVALSSLNWDGCIGKVL
ncbi:hypothetical protein VPH35_117720 [Triticum aestivum]